MTKEQQSSQYPAGTQAAGVDANLPKQNAAGSEQKQSNDQTQKREELTNYEVSSKSIQTTSAGFLIQNLSIAVLINRAALTTTLGDKASPEAIAAQVKEIEQLVASAAGLDKTRGDVVKISVVDFVEFEPRSRSRSRPFAGRDRRKSQRRRPVLIAAMVIWFGVRPGWKMLFAAPPVASASVLADATPGLQAAEAESCSSKPIPSETSSWRRCWRAATTAPSENC